jgi:hypothetical protein
MENLGNISSSLIFYFVAIDDDPPKMRAETYTRLSTMPQQEIIYYPFRQ